MKFTSTSLSRSTFYKIYKMLYTDTQVTAVLFQREQLPEIPVVQGMGNVPLTGTIFS